MASPRTAPGIVKLFLLSIAGFLWIVVFLKGQDQNAAVLGDGIVTVKTSDLPCQNNNLYTDSTLTTALYPIPANQTDSVDATKQSLSYKKDGICSLAADTVGEDSLLSASHWWTKHVANILAASQNSNDPQFIHKEWMTKLLATLTPEMLQKGVKVKPSAASFRKLLNLVHRRLLHPNTTQPIKVAVMGGSVTVGTGCNKGPPIPVEGFNAKGEGLRECAWANRLQVLINKLAGMELVKFSNLAVGGTSLEVAIPIVKYWLYPSELLPDGPDVVISAYSANEEYNNKGSDATKTVNFADAKRARVQDFILSIYRSHLCTDPPAIVFLDDYLGNQHDRIVGEMIYNRIVTEVAEWYGDVLHFSYADVVRRIVYADIDLALFNAKWPMVKGEPKVDAHFGMAGHMAIAWVFVYSLADVFSSFCQNEAFLEETPEVQTHSLINEATWKRVHHALPPPLTKETRLSQISRDWEDMEKTIAANKETVCMDDAQKQVPCEFAFIAGPAGSVRNPRQMQNYLNKFLRESVGWNPVDEYAAGGFAKKLGFVATQPNATFTLRLKEVTKEVRFLNIYTLKSYGEKWANSTARFTFTVENPGKEARTTSFDIKGFHDAQVSISHTFIHDLNEEKAVIGGNVTIRADLVGGTTFKIIGMMFCNR